MKSRTGMLAAAAKAAVVFALAFGAAMPASAATKKGWKGSGDRYWTTSGNWKDISANADGYFLRSGEGTTLAINAGKKLTTGLLTVNSGATLALPQSGTMTLGGNLTLASGSALAFYIDGGGDGPKLDVNGKTLTLPDGDASVTVTLSNSAYRIMRISEPYVLIKGAGLNEETDLAKFTLGENPPVWAKELAIVEGDLVLRTKNPGLALSFR